MSSCSFCDRTIVFGPFETVRLCEPCARRVAKLARRGARLVGSIWDTSCSSSPLPIDAGGEAGQALEDFKRGVTRRSPPLDADGRLNLAIAYREMSLFADAVREAALVVETATDRRKMREALEVLLRAPLLRATAFDVLRRELTAH
jgi:hypothetical protein